LFFFINSYVFKEEYTDALIKSVISGVLFTALFAFLMMRNEKRQQDEKEKIASQKKKR